MKHGIITAPQPEAVELGAEVLMRGGNAVDAAVACAFAQGVADNLMCGIAGFGFAHVFLPGKKIHTTYDFMSTAPAAVTAGMWEPLLEGETRDGFGFILKGRVNDIGYQSVAVPGNLKGYHSLHAAHGRLPWADVVAPAIRLAREGYTVTPYVRAYWTTPEKMGRVEIIDRIAYSKNARGLYFGDDGVPHQIGTKVRNPELADTLGGIAQDGDRSFYHGAVASRIDAEFRANGGHLSKADLEAYRVQERPPVFSTYRGLRLAVTPPPSSGYMMAKMLGILERFDLRALGHNSTAYIKLLAEVMKRAQIDKERYIGDPDFEPVPTAPFLDPAQHDADAAAIRRGERAVVPRLAPKAYESAETTQVSVMDVEGNVVSMTHTLGMQSGVITPGLGFMYNAAMAMFDPRPGRPMSLAPGKKRVSSMAPTILFDGDKPVLVTGAPGGSNIPMGILQTILNVVDFGMSIVEAVEAPRVSAMGNVIDVSHRIPGFQCDALRADGYAVARSAQSYLVARPHSIRVEGGRVTGSADPAAGGMALIV
ncbi:MAG: gamma-glutamyltransferase family protein [Alphaproteobacteria bacterium]|nr:gamma-glutamyltransferase family protein [Alphaproteobacteria bacterium]